MLSQSEEKTLLKDDLKKFNEAAINWNKENKKEQAKLMELKKLKPNSQAYQSIKNEIKACQQKKNTYLEEMYVIGQKKESASSQPDITEMLEDPLKGQENLQNPEIRLAMRDFLVRQHLLNPEKNILPGLLKNENFTSNALGREKSLLMRWLQTPENGKAYGFRRKRLTSSIVSDLTNVSEHIIKPEEKSGMIHNVPSLIENAPGGAVKVAQMALPYAHDFIETAPVGDVGFLQKAVQSVASVFNVTPHDFSGTMDAIAHSKFAVFAAAGVTAPFLATIIYAAETAVSFKELMATGSAGSAIKFTAALLKFVTFSIVSAFTAAALAGVSFVAGSVSGILATVGFGIAAVYQLGATIFSGIQAFIHRKDPIKYQKHIADFKSHAGNFLIAAAVTVSAALLQVFTGGMINQVMGGVATGAGLFGFARLGKHIYDTKKYNQITENALKNETQETKDTAAFLRKNDLAVGASLRKSSANDQAIGQSTTAKIFDCYDKKGRAEQIWLMHKNPDLDARIRTDQQREYLIVQTTDKLQNLSSELQKNPKDQSLQAKMDTLVMLLCGISKNEELKKISNPIVRERVEVHKKAFEEKFPGGYQVVDVLKTSRYKKVESLSQQSFLRKTSDTQDLCKAYEAYAFLNKQQPKKTEKVESKADAKAKPKEESKIDQGVEMAVNDRQYSNKRVS